MVRVHLRNVAVETASDTENDQSLEWGYGVFYGRRSPKELEKQNQNDGFYLPPPPA